jgi:hypothetical protein
MKLKHIAKVLCGGDGPNARSLYKVSMLAKGFKGRAK